MPIVNLKSCQTIIRAHYFAAETNQNYEIKILSRLTLCYLSYKIQKNELVWSVPYYQLIGFSFRTQFDARCLFNCFSCPMKKIVCWKCKVWARNWVDSSRSEGKLHIWNSFVMRRRQAFWQSDTPWDEMKI